MLKNIDSKTKFSIVFILAAILLSIFLELRSSPTERPNPIAKIAERNDKEGRYPKAIEVVGPSGFINLPEGKDEIAIGELIGEKVILVDFWTYTCINCIRTFPHLTSWYERYKDEGLEIIGIHTPEFEFEKKYENVLAATQRHNIKYPVVLDNDYATWNAYENRYWPRKYLIDIDGYIVYDHIGEGAYEETERKIQELLREAGRQVEERAGGLPDETPRTRNTPEIYLGSLRASNFYPTRTVFPGKEDFELLKDIPRDTYSLGGEWIIAQEYAQAGRGAVLELNFTASKVFLVMGPEEIAGKVRIFLDGEEAAAFGEDVNEGAITVNSERLYKLINSPDRGQHLLRLEFTPGIRIYAFTFG